MPKALGRQAGWAWPDAEEAGGLTGVLQVEGAGECRGTRGCVTGAQRRVKGHQKRLGAGGHPQRWARGTPASTCSTWFPQPAYVALPQVGQVMRRHMDDSLCSACSASSMSLFCDLVAQAADPQAA
ncbi:hypothetical protein ACH46I_08555 [Streptomyces griseofuscus]|uniref:hypothetical protein n=1 Tax=Streptomyces griseofuscus TaxID=146922 RepID=UPI001188C793|nr:hypothetical protein SRO_0542 [Streptomyces rochei]